jgi:hypothetical protein
MRRLLVLFAVLIPLSWFIAGCGGTNVPKVTKEDEAKMSAETQKKMAEMMKTKKQSPQNAPPR